VEARWNVPEPNARPPGLAVAVRWAAMPMRQECKHFESRTYANGDTVRKCDLDLAPDAPWRCPDNCPQYERRLAAVAWTHGSLVAPPTPDEPASVADGTAAALLDEAEDHLMAVGDRVRAEVAAERAKRNKGWRRFFGRS
jgi:hypothetical protein